MSRRGLILVAALTAAVCSACASTTATTTQPFTPSRSTTAEPAPSFSTTSAPLSADTSKRGIGGSGGCDGHPCIGNWQKEAAEGGTVIECSDGTWSHAGGISGACSHHGGETEGSADSATASDEGSATSSSSSSIAGPGAVLQPGQHCAPGLIPSQLGKSTVCAVPDSQAPKPTTESSDPSQPNAAMVVDGGPATDQLTQCADASGEPNTSCPFAENVYKTIENTYARQRYVPGKFRAYSPVTRMTYAVTCDIIDTSWPRPATVASEEVVCSNGTTRTSGEVTLELAHIEHP